METGLLGAYTFRMFHRHKDPNAGPKTVEEKLDVMIWHLERMDRRDKMRMWGGLLHSLLTIIPMVFFAWSTWYLYTHFEEIMATMMRQSAQNAAEVTGQSYEDILKQIQEAFGMGGSE